MTTIINGSSPSITFSDGSAQTSATRPFLNRLINGGMTIDQRNAGASVTLTATTYTLDRWYSQVAQSSKMSIQQNAGSVTPPVGFSNYLGVTSSSAYSVVAGDYFTVEQRIEGFNFADLNFGTANAKTVTISFWVRSSLTGTFGGALRNSASSYCYPFTYTISAANTWEQKSITITGATAGTWVGSTNGIGANLIFSMGMGSTYSGTAGAWVAGDYGSATGATSVVGTNGATFYITGVQLEVGSTATSFDYRPYGTELMLCQRYYQRTPSSNDCTILSMTATNGATAYRSFLLSPTMRAAPTVTLSDQGNSLFNNSSVNGTDITYFRADTVANATGNGYIRFQYSASAEL